MSFRTCFGISNKFKEQEILSSLALLRMTKPAFTLAEMMVVMLLLSIVLAASAPLMSKRTESTSLWRQTPNNANKIYYSTNDKQQALIGTKNDNVTNSKLHINSSNPSSYPHLTFSVNGAYAGVINVESTSRMSVKLAESTGNTFALDNSNLYVNGNVDIGQVGTNYTLKLNGNPR